MKYAQQAGEVSWTLIKFILELIWRHLSYFLFVEFIGFLIAILLSYLIVRISKRKGVFSRDSESKFSLFLNKAYKPLLFLSMFFLVMTFTTHFVLSRIVKKEITLNVENGFEYLETNYLKEESTRQQMYQMGELIIKGGSYIKDFNQAVAMSAGEFNASQTDQGFIVAKMSGYMISHDIEEKLIELEKGTLFYLTGLAIHKMGIDPGDFYDYDLFEKGFDKWYELEFDDTAISLKKIISSFIYKYVKPLIFTIFIPFILIGLGVLSIPYIHFFFYKRKLKKAQLNLIIPNQEDTDVMEEENTLSNNKFVKN